MNESKPKGLTKDVDTQLMVLSVVLFPAFQDSTYTSKKAPLNQTEYIYIYVSLIPKTKCKRIIKQRRNEKTKWWNGAPPWISHSFHRKIWKLDFFFFFSSFRQLDLIVAFRFGKFFGFLLEDIFTRRLDASEWGWGRRKPLLLPGCYPFLRGPAVLRSSRYASTRAPLVHAHPVAWQTRLFGAALHPVGIK